MAGLSGLAGAVELVSDMVTRSLTWIVAVATAGALQRLGYLH